MTSSDKAKKASEKVKQKKSDKKSVKNKSLLSFDDEEEEEDWCSYLYFYVSAGIILCMRPGNLGKVAL